MSLMGPQPKRGIESLFLSLLLKGIAPAVFFVAACVIAQSNSQFGRYAQVVTPSDSHTRTIYIVVALVFIGLSLTICAAERFTAKRAVRLFVFSSLVALVLVAYAYNPDLFSGWWAQLKNQ